ncbi:MAG: hypothetical protein J6B24_06595, partial [Clostridia bacterium]|nr:hypothetical protein [Clostridia bacterium]
MSGVMGIISAPFPGGWVYDHLYYRLFGEESQEIFGSSNLGLSNCLTEQVSMFFGGYSSVTPFGRATFPHKGRLIQYV